MKDLEKLAADYKERLKSFKINPDQAKSILSQVEKMAKNSHNEWMKVKLANGWKLGPDNKENKTNPNLVPYDELDEETKEDQSYDWTTAKGIIDGIPNNMIFVSFKLAEAIQQAGSEK